MRNTADFVRGLETRYPRDVSPTLSISDYFRTVAPCEPDSDFAAAIVTMTVEDNIVPETVSQFVNK